MTAEEGLLNWLLWVFGQLKPTVCGSVIKFDQNGWIFEAQGNRLLVVGFNLLVGFRAEEDRFKRLKPTVCAPCSQVKSITLNRLPFHGFGRFFGFTVNLVGYVFWRSLTPLWRVFLIHFPNKIKNLYVYSRFKTDRHRSVFISHKKTSSSCLIIN